MAEGTVHIVADEEAIRESLTVVLSAAGVAVAVYPSADTFLSASAPAPGCVLIDVRMPGMGGLELQEELARRGRRVPVILMTGHTDVPLAVKAMKAGAVDFVEKPVEEQAMLAAIRRAFGLGGEAARAQAERNRIGGRLALLTPREREVLEALAAGKANKTIAHELSISPRTVEIHRARVMEKMAARTLSDLVRMARSVGLGPKHASSLGHR